MHRAQCFLPFFALLISFGNSWDIATTAGNQLEFYSNGTKTNSETFRDLTALAYDAVHNMLLFVDKENDNASIFSYHIATKKIQPLVRRKSNENLQGVAFDPITGLLFWTDFKEKSIYWKSLKNNGSKNDIYGNILLKFNEETPRAIAVDSCRGYIYWTNTNLSKATIERARFNGSEREVIVNNSLFMPVSIAIDQRTRKLYWADDKEGIEFSIESSDLNGKNRKVLLSGIQQKPNSLTVSKDEIIWVDWGYKKVWSLSKDHPELGPQGVLPIKNRFGIVANYRIADQTEGIPECQALTKLSLNKSAINDSFNIPRDAGLFCLHGDKIDGKLACKCTPGYTGERCEVSLCRNYCVQGDCNISPDGEPKCKCKNGFTGDRCELDPCHNHCLNNGACTMRNDKPVCICKHLYDGDRCEKQVEAGEPTTPRVADTQPESCNCTASNTTTLRSENTIANDGEFVETCNDGWDAVRDPIIMVLGILSGLLCLLCAFLTTKILQLKKRPRIKKRIIVNKNVTPLTARPDQCEITIENCCNMNICETPCFEPRSTIRPTLIDAKPGKEEKKTLINNMEYPDDY